LYLEQDHKELTNLTRKLFDSLKLANKMSQKKLDSPKEELRTRNIPIYDFQEFNMNSLEKSDSNSSEKLTYNERSKIQDMISTMVEPQIGKYFLYKSIWFG